MPLKLYQSNLSPYAARVRILAQAKGLKLECKHPPGGGLKAPEYLALNPLGKVPCLEHDGAVLPESETICEYLEDTFPTPTLRPVDPQARAKTRLISRMGDLYLAPPLTVLFGQLNPETRDRKAVDAAIGEYKAALDHIAHFLEGPDYAIGGRLSLADCALVPLLYFVDALIGPAFGDSAAMPPKIRAYYDGAARDPHVSRALGEIKVALQERMKQQAAS